MRNVIKMRKCDKCEKWVWFGGKKIEDIELFLCNECWSEVVKVILEKFKSDKKKK